MKKVLLLLTLLLLPLIALYGCGSGGATLGKTDTGDSSPITVSKTGSLDVSAEFPQKGEIGTALIDENTASIKVRVLDANRNFHTLTLTRSNPRGTITNIPVGSVEIDVNTYDSAEKLLDYMEIRGEIVEGQNTLVATLIRGSWKLVDAAGNPTSIRLNKTLSSDTSTINSFSIIPYYSPRSSSIAKASITHPERDYGESYYGLLWKGTGFSTDLCGTTNTCNRSDDVNYFNQFIGPSTNNNALDGGELPLPPTQGYVPTEYDPTNRRAFFAGIIPQEKEIEFSDPAVLNYINTRVTGATTIEGTIVELLFKSSTWTVTCYAGTEPTGNPITCPWKVGSQGVRKANAQTKAISKALAGKGIMKAAPNAQGCFIDLSGSESETRTINWDLDRDGQWDDPVTVVQSGTWTVDACVHPFKAIGSQLPETDLGVIIQRSRK